MSIAVRALSMLDTHTREALNNEPELTNIWFDQWSNRNGIELAHIEQRDVAAYNDE